jgi:RNA polymerase sigma factor (TIGR02999 family)
MDDFNRLLTAADDGDQNAAERLLPLVYDELRRLAAALLASEKPGQTLQPTALVHEAYLRLVGNQGPGASGQEPAELKLVPGSRLPARSYNGRTHFFAAAAEAMRRILVDQARRKMAQKHGGQLARQELIDSDIAATAPPEEVLAVHQYLDLLAAEDPLAAGLIKLHYFGGFSIEEAGDHLGLSRATAYRLFAFGRAWLRDRMKDDESS